MTSEEKRQEVSQALALEVAREATWAKFLKVLTILVTFIVVVLITVFGIASIVKEDSEIGKLNTQHSQTAALLRDEIALLKDHSGEIGNLKNVALSESSALRIIKAQTSPKATQKEETTIRSIETFIVVCADYYDLRNYENARDLVVHVGVRDCPNVPLVPRGAANSTATPLPPAVP
jgi:hypothetical protein